MRFASCTISAMLATCLTFSVPETPVASLSIARMTSGVVTSPPSTITTIASVPKYWRYSRSKS